VKQPSNSSSVRIRLLKQQAELLRALVDREPTPLEFDSSRLQAAADALSRKRCKEAANAWPALAHWLGKDFARRFASYARTSPLPSEGGPLADGWAFLDSLQRTERLPDRVRQERFAVGLRYVWHGRGLHARRGLALKILLLSKSRCLLIGWRCPQRRSKSIVIIKSIGLRWIGC
jgi:hypothetical protein